MEFFVGLGIGLGAGLAGGYFLFKVYWSKEVAAGKAALNRVVSKL